MKFRRAVIGAIIGIVAQAWVDGPFITMHITLRENTECFSAVSLALHYIYRADYYNARYKTNPPLFRGLPYFGLSLTIVFMVR